MHTIYTLARLFPYWALPVAFLVAELGWYFRRKRSASQHFCWLTTVTLVVTAISWIAFRGDLHSDRWVRLVFGG